MSSQYDNSGSSEQTTGWGIFWKGIKAFLMVCGALFIGLIGLCGLMIAGQ